VKKSYGEDEVSFKGGLERMIRTIQPISRTLDMVKNARVYMIEVG
jgi:hypothetical protein